MACVNPDGTLSETAKQVLRNLRMPNTLKEIAIEANLPTFLVRASLREMGSAGFVVEMDGIYSITEVGHATLEDGVA